MWRGTPTPPRPEATAIAAIALGALAIASAFAATTLAHTRTMGLPLDDSYIYLTYAKQFGRGQPFTYFPGGPYSAGSTSVLWPMLLAPFWTLGARGHALVWVSFGTCAALYAAVAVGSYLLARTISGDLAGVLAAVMVLAVAPFAWCALSGMEVALASALLLATLRCLVETPAKGRPSWKLVACLAATSLSRPEAMLVVGGSIAIAVARRIRQRDLRAATSWLVPLVAPASWMCANRLFAGHFVPNTALVKSHFYLPGFDWTYWLDAVVTTSDRMLRGLFWDETSPLVWPRTIAALGMTGAVRVALWAKRERRWAGGLVIGAPFLLMFGFVASSAQPWNFQNHRYVAPALPLIMILAGVALAPPPLAERAPHRRWLVRGWSAAACVATAAFVRSSLPGLAADMRLFAQGAMDTNTQVVAIGQYVRARLPDATVMFHDAGAIAYYGDGHVYDMLGLVTNDQASIANNGPGARFEFLESLPPGQRPTHFAYYPSWMGAGDFYGDVLMHTPLRPDFEPRRLVGDADMELIVASFEHVGTGERPLDTRGGWAVVDGVDVADLASERTHRWVGDLGRRHLDDPTARWSVVEREVGAQGLVIDGGRTIREGGERFTIALDPAKPTRLVIRTGGQRRYPFHETIDAPITLRLHAGAGDGREIGRIAIAPPDGTFSELPLNLPPHAFDTREIELRSETTGLYRVFHWFVLQPE
jgi:hypothetical protein